MNYGHLKADTLYYEWPHQYGRGRKLGTKYNKVLKTPLLDLLIFIFVL